YCGFFLVFCEVCGDVDCDFVIELFPHDVPFGFEPVPVVDARSRSAAVRALLRSLRKPQDGWTSTYLNRHVSLAITRVLVATPFSPNQVSIVILAIGLAGAYLASRGTYLDM